MAIYVFLNKSKIKKNVVTCMSYNAREAQRGVKLIIL